MDINFALSLSHDGIEMLHRARREWQLVGRVGLDSPTFHDDLTALREQAKALSPDGFFCKLVIPAAQIKFLTIDAELSNQTEVLAALDGATPYALSELAVDFERASGQTFIASVALETLQEAEDFAMQAGFNPVAFIAEPPAATFNGEVFFGTTSVMSTILGTDAVVTRDAAPIRRTKAETNAAMPVDQSAPPATPQRPRIDAIPAEVLPQAAMIEPEVAFQTRRAADLLPQEQNLPQAKTEPARNFVIVETSAKAPAAPASKTIAAPFRTTEAPSAPTTNKRLIGLAASVAFAAAVLGWILLPLQSDVATPATAQIDLPAPLLADDTAFQSAPTLAPITPTATLPFKSAAATSDPILDLLTQTVMLNAPVIDTTPPPGPLIGPRVYATVAPLFGEFAPASFGLPSGMAIQEPAPTTLLPTLTQSEVPQPDVTAPQTPPPPPVSETIAVATPPAAIGTVLSPSQAQAFYEATGVWQRSPRLIDTPSGAILFGFTPPDDMTPAPRVAPPVFAMRATERPIPFAAPRNPPPPDVIFARDENGFIAATPEGTLTPDGTVVIAGLPDLPVRPRPQLSAAQLAQLALLAPAAPTDGVIVIAGPPDVIPPLRPRDFVVAEADAPPADAAALGGVGLAGLELQQTGTIGLDAEAVEARADSDLRPQLRPTGLAIETETAAEGTDITDILREIAASDATLRFDNSTSLAVRASIRPDTRPDGFGRVVAAAQAPPATATAPIVAAAPVPPQNFAPVPGGVARAATQEDVIRLREINLIGIYGRPNARRALVRLPNGRYVRVEVGSALDGGQVTAIGDEALNYVKRGRTFAVEMPSQ